MRPEPAARRPRWSRDQIAQAALGLADDEGFEAVSMRRVAEVLGAGTMSLYHYVKSRDELVALMDDALMREALLPQARTDYPGAILEIARRTHAAYVRHPWALTALRRVPPGPSAMEHVEQCLEALSETKLAAREKVLLLALVDDFVFGHALRVAEREVEYDPAFARAQIATGRFPRIEETFGDGAVDVTGDRLERGLAAILASVSAKPAPSKRRRSRRRPSGA